MSQAFFTSMSGINANQTLLSVVSNNIANLNTTGFKSSQVNFSDIFYNTISYGSSGSQVSNTGGTNPKQIGVGVQVASIDRNFNNGTWSATGKATDLYINGKGFFTLVDPSGGLCFTRDGSFNLDANGYLVSAKGFRVAGTDNLFGLSGSTTPIKVPISLSAQTIPNETADIGMKGIRELNGASITRGLFFTDIKYTDSAGDTQVISDVRIDTTNANNMNDIASIMQAAIRSAANQSGTDVFDPSQITVKCDETTGGKLVISAGDDVKLNFKSTSSTNEPGTTDFIIMSELSEAGSTGGVTTYNTKILDYKQVLDFSDASGTVAQYKGINITEDGKIEVLYSNGDKLSVVTDPNTGENKFKYTTSDYFVITGDDVIVNPLLVNTANLQIQMASFVNDNGLIAYGNNMFKTGENTGQTYFGTCASGAFGAVTSGGLEASNVDLAKEFSSMIIAQRGIQANSRVFSTASDIMETISYLGRS